MKKQIFRACIALSLAAAGTLQAGPHSYFLTEFTGLPGSAGPGVFDLNNFGVAAGSLGEQAAYWSSPTNAHLLAGLGDLYAAAFGINDVGNACGKAFVDAEHQRAVYWEGTAAAQILPDLDTRPDMGNSTCNQLNGAAAKIGTSQTFSGDTHATAWDSANGIHDLGTLQGSGDSEAVGINASGSIVGSSSFTYPDGGTAKHAVLWRNGSLMDLGTLGGRNSFADAINDAGQIVGYADLNVGTSDSPAINHPILWSSGASIDLGLPAGFLRGDAYSINASGAIVGDAYNDPGNGARLADSHAVLWDQGEIVDLAELLRPQLPSNTLLVSAFKINDSGRILLFGFDHVGLVGHYYLATPISATHVTLRSSENPAFKGDPVQFIAQVTADSGVIPHTSVSLRDGRTLLQVAPLDAQGIARFRPISNLSLGTHQLRASFSGYEAFAPSTSPVLNEVIRLKLIPLPR